MEAPPEPRSDLAWRKPRLRHYLRALFDVEPAILPIERSLAATRPFLSNLGLHLPQTSPHARHWYEAAAAHAAAHLRYSVQPQERGSLKPLQVALMGLLEDARVEAIACRDLPGLRRLWLGFHTAGPAQGDSVVVLMLRLARCLLDPSQQDPHPWVDKGRRLFGDAVRNTAASATEHVAALRRAASVLGNDIGQMRLQFNAREYVVEPSYRDDNAALWTPPDDAQPQTRRAADEDGQQEAPVRPANTAAPADAPISARFQYPEWDRLISSYRPDWCSVIESPAPPGEARDVLHAAQAHAALLAHLNRVLRMRRVRDRVRLRAQLRGNDLDIDAAVKAIADRRSGHAPGQKVHQRTDHRERDVAALLLLDTSASMAGPAAHGRTVRDLARDAAVLTALTMQQAGDPCAIHGFCSNGRGEVRYERFKDFDESMGTLPAARLAGMRSRQSTRMGAALRHATQALAAQRHERRLLLLITDGEPHDIDIFDERYLIEDTRRAVCEAMQRGISVFCVSLDARADGYLRAMFGVANYRVLDRIEALPSVLPCMYLKLAR